MNMEKRPSNETVEVDEKKFEKLSLAEINTKLHQNGKDSSVVNVEMSNLGKGTPEHNKKHSEFLRLGVEAWELLHEQEKKKKALRNPVK